MKSSKVHEVEFNGAIYEYHLDSDGVINVIGKKCGFEFDVCRIIEPYSDNPLVTIPNPLGRNAIQAIIEQLPLL